MLKFFRSIRKDLVNNGKSAKYFKYALGEIALVMIGILLALQVGNWKDVKKERNLEKRYLSELILDLQTDSIAIDNLIKISNRQSNAKNKLIDYYKGIDISKDSLIIFFNEQWNNIYGFNPIITTLDEMKSTGNVGVIRNSNLRRKILETYNNYKAHINQEERLFNIQQTETMKVLFSKVPNLDFQIFSKPNNLDLTSALEDFEIKNRLLGNYVNGMSQALTKLKDWNIELLRVIREELHKMN